MLPLDRIRWRLQAREGTDLSGRHRRLGHDRRRRPGVGRGDRPVRGRHGRHPLRRPGRPRAGRSGGRQQPRRRPAPAVRGTFGRRCLRAAPGDARPRAAGHPEHRHLRAGARGGGAGRRGRRREGDLLREADRADGCRRPGHRRRLRAGGSAPGRQPPAPVRAGLPAADRARGGRQAGQRDLGLRAVGQGPARQRGHATRSTGCAW